MCTFLLLKFLLVYHNCYQNRARLIATSDTRTSTNDFKGVLQEQGIASARVVVDLEMKMEQLKNYRILSDTLPLSEALLAEQMVFYAKHGQIFFLH